MTLFKNAKPETVTVNGEPFHCTVCGNTMFMIRRSQLNTSVATFFNMDWANQSAVCAVCTQCKYIHWFMPD